MAMRKQYKTARGSKFDMDQFTNKKEETLALGNLGGAKATNARGDILGQGGKIVVKREEAVRRYYREELPKTTKVPISDESMASAPSIEGTPGKIVKTDDLSVFQTPDEAFDQLTTAVEEKEKKEVKSTRRSKKE